MAHAAGMAHGPENSLKAALQSIKYGTDIIELDVRKSSDGILFAYHGFGALKFLAAAIFIGFLPFKLIEKWLEVDTIDKIIKGIKTKTILYLDLKDSKINWRDIKKVSQDSKHDFWIASTSIKQLAKLSVVLPKKYTLVHNTGFLNFKKGIAIIKKLKIDIKQVFPWQFTKSKIGMLKKAGIRFNVCNAIMSQKQQKRAVKEFGSEFLCYNDVKKRDEFVNSIHNI